MTSTSVLRTTVREARPEEAGAVAALVRDGYTAYADELPPDLLRTWVDDVADPGGGVTFVAVVDGALAGTARLHLAGTYPVPLPGGSAGVRAVVVAPAYRRTGVASVLMATCAERARAAGAAALYLHTAPFMTGAVALYDGLGYRRDPATDLDVGAHFGAGPADAVVAAAYRLDLAPACRIVRGGEAYEGRQGLAYDAGFTVIARTDPNEQKSVVLMPELDAVPDREEP